MDLLDHKVNVYLNLSKPTEQFSKTCIPFYTRSNDVWVLVALKLHQHSITSLFLLAFYGYIVISHGILICIFLIRMLNTFSCSYWPFIYHYYEIFVKSFVHFYMKLVIFLLSKHEILCIFWIPVLSSNIWVMFLSLSMVCVFICLEMFLDEQKL